MSMTRYVFNAGVLLAVAFAGCIPAAAVDQRLLNNGNLVLEGIPEIPAQVVADLNRYQNIRSAIFQGWSHQGDSIYITTRFAEVAQLHRVDQAGGARRQLTFFNEPIREVSINPRSGAAAFTMDAGGSEFTQIYILDLQSGEYRMISDGKSRNGSLLWSGDGRRLAYTSTRRNGSTNDVWVATIAEDGTAAHAIAVAAEDGSGWSPVAFSSAGDQLLVEQYVSATRSYAFLKDLRSGNLARIAGDPGQESQNHPVDFTRRGDGVFMITDRHGEFAQLVVRDLRSGDETVVTGDIPWDVEYAVVSDDRRRAAFVTNEDGYSRLHVLEPETLDHAPVPAAPAGVVVGRPAFSPQGDRLALSISAANHPADVYVVDLGVQPSQVKGSKRWTESETGGLDPASFREPELVHYPAADRHGRPESIPAFVYRPAGSEPFPVIILIHGGPESQYRPSFSSDVQLWLNKLGAAVIAPNVRGSSGYGKAYLTLDNGMRREDSVRDIGALLNWMRAQPYLDADRVAVYGASYGGYMALASAVHYSDRLRAAVDVVGISNFVNFLENTQDYRRDLRRVEYGDERDPPMREFLLKISPGRNVDRIAIPLLVIQGQNDPRVPVTESEQIVQALRARGQPVWYMNALNEGHGYRKKENNDVAGQVVMMFYTEHLVGGRE